VTRVAATIAPGRWALCLIGFGFAPLVLAFFCNLWKQPEYQFFPQALAGAGFLAWSRLGEVPRPLRGGKPTAGGFLLLVSFALLALATILWSPWLGAVAALPAIVAILWLCGGASLLRGMAPALVMLLTIIPPPLGLDARFTLLLRGVATTLSSRLLDLLGVVHCVGGNVIELPGQKLLVEEACSGIHSVLFVTAFCLFFLLWRRRAFWAYLVCLPAALAFVVMGNVFRISLGAWLRYHGGPDLLSGWKHESLSIVLVSIYVLLVLSLDHLLPHAKHPPVSARAATPPPDISPPAAWKKSTGTIGLWMAGCLFGLLGLAGTYRAWEKSKSAPEPLLAATPSLRGGIQFSMPDHLGDWTRSDPGPPSVSKIETLGLSSIIWTYQRPGMKAVVAFDYPISGYHDVATCYSNAGWNLADKERIVPGTNPPPRIEIEMRKEPSIHGTLWFATLNERGQWVDESTLRHDLMGRIEALGVPRETTCRIQLLIVGKGSLNLAEREAATGLFEESAAILSRQMMGRIPR